MKQNTIVTLTRDEDNNVFVKEETLAEFGFMTHLFENALNRSIFTLSQLDAICSPEHFDVDVCESNQSIVDNLKVKTDEFKKRMVELGFEKLADNGQVMVFQWSVEYDANVSVLFCKDFE